MIIIMDNGRMPEIESESEFLQAISSANIVDVLEALDCLMDELKLMYPKRYRSLINQIVAKKIVDTEWTRTE